ncbi:D-alanyl-lipoteichoic acid biosynthesis protein DltD [Pseudanabaena mucicola]|uniref:DUF1574 family protein n=1 Tax=Pseudanabaena mucicola FACHB-723 TaxID=2692860 RepID=A0ABR7ZY49_9CYAN|nr:D-alanyl-lipoteichoic acid biosynthesis protein DltD [Pseudanabaena mucicola]MBD2188873.1 DUF1574 family protein [Pseudanabaena mucicola FACHB-723]
METTSLDANPITTNPKHNSKEESNFNLEEIHRLNNVINNANINVNIPIPNVVSKFEFGQDGATTTFAEGLAGLKLSHSKQKGDCLYLYSKDREVNAATTILEAIAPNTQDLESSILYSEGIHRLKLHGNDWALGLDLPITQSAIVATEIIAAILTTFRQESQLVPKLAQTKLKLLLQNNCLNLLCETPVAILQAEIALPMLNTLRTLRAAEYFQSVTVSSRVIGEKKPSWSFEIDLLAIGQPEPTLESELDIDEKASELEPQAKETVSYSFQDSLESKSQLFAILKDIFYLRWLGQTTPTMISLPACLASLALGIGVTVAIDRTLNSYRQVEQPNKLILADSKIDLSVNQGTEVKDGKVINKPTPNFNIALLNEKLSILDWQTNNKKQPPDVLIVGSSRALRGIEPQTLETALNQKGYQNISVFNFGIDGATAKVVNVQLTEILSRPQLPKMIIWADGLRAFNSSRNDITYDEITTSVGYKQLQESLKNNNQPIPTKAIATESPSTDLITQSFSSLLTSLSHRQEVRTALVKKFDRNTQMLSNSEALVAATMPSTVTALDIKGFVAFDVTFDPNTYFQKFPQVPGDYDLDYRNFEASGNQFDAFSNVIEFCRRNNITLLVVNMPLHRSYLDSIRTNYEAIFNSKMKELALREGFTYLDLSQTIQNQAELFSDPSHLNQKGAVAIAKLIAQNPKIPWQKLSK